MVVGFKSPHSPRGGKNLPDRLRERYTGETSRKTPNFMVPAIYHAKPGVEIVPHSVTENATHLDYMRHVDGADQNLGRLLDTLDQLGLTDDTVVVFTSDNGYFLGEHNLGDKRAAYEESLRVPMLVRYPKMFGKGKVLDQLVLNIDLAPTFLDLAGVEIPKEMQGKSWKQLATGQGDANWRTSFFAEYFKEMGDTPTWVGVRTAHTKLVQYTDRPELTEVFQLDSDPYEIRNLASDKSLADPLQTELDKFMKTMRYTNPLKR